MKKLIAKRPIQYMGRTYERGAAIPAQDPKMVAAWLKAGSAAWVGDAQETVDTAIQETARRSRASDMAAEAIRAMGVTIEDAAGEFVGASSMEEQIRALFGPGSLQDGVDGNMGGQDAPGEGENGQDSGTPAMPAGNLNAADLEKWKKTDLEKLAEDMGVDISKARNNVERAAILSAAEGQAPANDPSNGGGAL